MDTQKRIEAIKEYFREMKVFSDENNVQNIYVSVNFPPIWAISDLTAQKYNTQAVKADDGLTYFWSELSNGMDNVFDAIDFNITENINAQKKVELYERKKNELRSIFENDAYTLEDLMTLSISINATKPVIKAKMPWNSPKPQKMETPEPQRVEAPMPTEEEDTLDDRNEEMPKDIPSFEELNAPIPIETKKKKK